MAPSPSRQLEQVLNKTRQPLLSELDSDLKYHICHDPFLSGKEPEIPIKMPCGHTCGQSCILKWLSPLSKEGKNSCPMCHKAIIDDWDRGFEDEVPERVGGTRVEAPATRPRIRVTGPVPTQQARLRAAFAQAYGQAYEQARGATLEEAASDLEAMDITMECERLQRARDEQNRRLWIQFCECVVRIVEGSGYLDTSERLPVARLILRIDSFEGFLRLRAAETVTHHRVLSTLPRLHTELVVIREIPSVDSTGFSDAERSWGPGANFFMLHAAGWYVRLYQNGQLISAEFPLGQRVIEETREEFEELARGPRVTSSETQSPRARLETDTPDNIFTSTSPRDLIVF